MQPFQFGIAHEPLYGVYHPPLRPSSQPAAVLLCPPIGHEYQQTHWAYKQLANRLGKLGFPVLRFDYFGTGNASGDTAEGNIERWLKDIQLAGETLLKRSGATRLITIGWRMGATLTVLASHQQRPDIMILWDPVISGQQYLSNLQALHHAKLEQMNRTKDFPPDRRPLDLMGYIFSDTLLNELNNLDLLTTSLHAPDTLTLLIDTNNHQHQQWVEKLQQHGTPFTSNIIEDIPNWHHLKSMEAALLPNKTLNKITQQLKKLIP